MSEAETTTPTPEVGPAAPSVLEGAPATETVEPAEAGRLPPSSVPSPPADAQESPSARGGAPIVLALLAFVVALGALGLPFLRPAGIAGGEDKLKALETQVAALESFRTEIPALTTRVQALEAAGSPLASDTEQRLAAVAALAAQLSERLAALEARPVAATERAVPMARALDGEVDSLRADLEKLGQELAAQGAQTGQRLDGLDARLASTASDLGNRPTTPELADLRRRVAATERHDSAIALRQATFALALTGLGSAVRSGAPYTESLETVRLLAPSGADLSVLSAHAGAGVPAMASLAREFPAASRAAAEAGRNESNRSVWDRIWSSLSWLVTVRRTDVADGESTEAALAAMQSALAVQDLDGALIAADGLNAPARKSLSPWLERAQQRRDAEFALRTVQARAVGALAATVASLGGDAATPPAR